MNKKLKTSQRSVLTFGDLVSAVSSSSKNAREAAAAIEDLLRRGRITFASARGSRRHI